MDAAEIRQFKVEVLDDIHELATEPVADPETLRSKVEAFFDKLEADSGKART
jgi:hypothetical protein